MWNHVVFENSSVNVNESTRQFIPEDKFQHHSTLFSTNEKDNYDIYCQFRIVHNIRVEKPIKK